jgi:selenide,water dikinase
MAAASQCTLRIDPEAVPVLPGALGLATGNVPGGARNNREYFGERVSVSSVDPVRLALLYDPQTSGGLLVAVAAGAARELENRLGRASASTARIGVVEARAAAAVIVG